MTARYVLAGDLGSGGCKTVILNESAGVVSRADASYATSYLHPGWAEQNPEDWYAAFCETCRQAVADAGIDPGAIAAVGLVGVTHNTVLLDAASRPLRNAILTFDQRSAPQCEQLLDRWGERVHQETLNGISPLWTWPQLEWIREHEPGTWSAVNRLLFQKDYVRDRLAPSHVTDTIDAAGTLLFNPRSESWITDFCEALDLPTSAWPEVVKPTDVVATVSDRAADETGLRAGTPVIAGTTDTAAEVFGSGLLKPGQGMIKLASVGRLAVVTEAPSTDPRVLNYRHVLEGLWYPGSGTKSAATTPRWVRDVFCPGQTYAAMDAAAAKVPPGSDGLLFHPHLLGEWAPHWDDSLRANFIGATMRHTSAHFIRAALEGVAFSLRAAVEALRNLGIGYEETRLIGGGAKSELWPRIVCDVLDEELRLPVEQDAAYGAALITGMAVGVFDPDPAVIEGLIQVRDHLEPDPAHRSAYDDLFGVYRDADGVLVEIAHRLTEIERREP